MKHAQTLGDGEGRKGGKKREREEVGVFVYLLGGLFGREKRTSFFLWGFTFTSLPFHIYQISSSLLRCICSNIRKKGKLIIKRNLSREHITAVYLKHRARCQKQKRTIETIKPHPLPAQGESMPLLISSPNKKLHCPRFQLRPVPPTNAIFFASTN